MLQTIKTHKQCFKPLGIQKNKPNELLYTAHIEAYVLSLSKYDVLSLSKHDVLSLSKQENMNIISTQRIATNK